MNINFISFKANTNISDQANVLTSREIRKLTKKGEKIGRQTDTINISIRKYQDGLFFSHSANFNSIANPTESSGRTFYKQEEVIPFKFISEKLTKLQGLYKRLKKI